MILQEIESEIRSAEQQKVTFNNVRDLALLYFVREHFTQASLPLTKMIEPESSDISLETAESEFLKSVRGKDSETVWNIMNELMSTIQMLEPKLYNAVMRKIQEVQ